MPFCPNCGTPVENLNDTCPSCGMSPNGAPKDTTPETEAPETPVVEPEIITDNADQNSTPAPRQLNMAQLIWGIVNAACCCTPLGIAGIILAVMAKDAPTDEEEKKKLKIAMILNIIGTAGGAVISLLSFILSFMSGLAGAV